MLPQRQEEERAVPTAVVASLLGPEAATYPMNEQTFREALRLRTEQEKTRQEQVRLEVTSRNLAIMEFAVRNEVPPHLIPPMMARAPPSEFQPMVSPQQPAPIQPHVLGPPGCQTYYYPQMSPYAISRQSPSGRTYDHPDNASIVAPMNYRFGVGHKVPPETPQRTLLPAKIGAAAVAGLTNPATPFRQTYRLQPSHQRHFSMPSDPFGPAIRLLDRHKYKAPPLSRLRSPSGSTSAMQVKPLPAQPLNKQTKNSQVPSQESMTSFQHIIQFQHWKPLDTGDQLPPPLAEKPRSDIPLGQYAMEPLATAHSRSTSRAKISHKRHKSSDMSVDLTALSTPYFPAPAHGTGAFQVNETAEEDVSMDTSDTSGANLKPSDSDAKGSKTRKAGRPRRGERF